MVKRQTRSDNVITGYVYEGMTYETTFGASTQNPFYSEPATESATGTVSANIFNVLGPTSYEVYVETGAVYTEDGSESTGDSEAQSQGGDSLWPGAKKNRATRA